MAFDIFSSGDTAIRRMWINQPSTQQRWHHRHGELVLARRESERTTRIYPLSGPIESEQIDHLALSPGWPEHLR